MMLNTAPAAADHLRDLLRAISDPAAAQARIDAIASAEKRLGDLEARAAQLDLDRRRHEEAKSKWSRDQAAERAALDKATEALSAREREHQKAVEQHRQNVQKHERDVAAFVVDRNRHAARLAEVERLRAALS